MREPLYTWITIWVKTILNHINTRPIVPWFCPSRRVLTWHIALNGIENKITVKYPYPTCSKKIRNPHYTYPNYIKKDDTSTGTHLPLTGWMLPCWGPLYASLIVMLLKRKRVLKHLFHFSMQVYFGKTKEVVFTLREPVGVMSATSHIGQSLQQRIVTDLARSR